MKALYIAWQDPENRRWHTVGRLSREHGHYQFMYTKGSQESPRFDYLGRMRDKEKVYHSDTLFPLFANRVLDASRPEYPDYLNWMGIDDGGSKMELLARSGGRRGTDKLCVYPEVEPNDQGEIVLYFFSHGLRYLNEVEQATIRSLRTGDYLQLTPDDTNQYDRYALLLETKEPVRVGYCPRYLSQDLFRVQQQVPIRLTVEKMNPQAPLQFRLLCKAVLIPPKGFALYTTGEHQPLAREVEAA
ncbi:MAG: HIRAN domain-containing protein [Candidatus Thiodiazotropha sp. (ex Epidulcina cf. delphinae)]|nr:HIRAN domain-containing protein [Candidatus Thiodiazotropha sp. (ex Epidulcina cf. delphinae)]